MRRGDEWQIPRPGAGQPSALIHSALAAERSDSESGGMALTDAGRATEPPDEIDDAPISVEEASELMARLGFVAFRTPPDDPVPDSCLMAVIHDLPTRQHFDPEAASFWVLADRHGRLAIVDRESPTPMHRRFVWGRIRLIDRFGARNSFVGFGGTLDAERVGQDARLLVFRSPAPILRLPGHSQLEDRLAEEALGFFGRLIPRLWGNDGAEEALASAGPEALYAAFLVDASTRLGRSEAIRSASGADVAAVGHGLATLEHHHPAALQAGRALLAQYGLATDTT